MTSREVTIRKVIGRKTVKDKVYTYTYYTLPLNLYIPKSVVEKYGMEFIVERDEERGTITIRPKKQIQP
ncbi:MAG: hypothetical protein RMH77_00945 [Sulfolobales archaeon]|nr:hypothetical protein [Sulfolobales archaeon]MCX8186304.1 hypothetical protein [Sulfolobales archaeon]MDW7968960.1 hypothetical protein [Sulfolobales archaeon]